MSEHEQLMQSQAAIIEELQLVRDAVSKLAEALAGVRAKVEAEKAVTKAKSSSKKEPATAPTAATEAPPAPALSEQEAAELRAEVQRLASDKAKTAGRDIVRKLIAEVTDGGTAKTASVDRLLVLRTELGALA